MNNPAHRILLGGLLLALVLLPEAAVADHQGEGPSSTSLQVKLNAHMERFTEEDARKLKRVRTRYYQLALALQAGQMDEQRMDTVTAELRKLWPIRRRLEDKKRQWENRVLAPEDRPGEDSSTPDTFLSPRSSKGDKEFDTRAFYELLLNFWNMGNPVDTNPKAEEWEALATEFEPFVRAQGESIDVKRYVLRAWLLQARCYLRASVRHFEAGRTDEQYASYTKGVEMLASLYKVCRDWEDDKEADVLQTIPVVTKPFSIRGVEQIGTKREWSERAWATSQTPTGDAARQALTEYCPWGYENFRFLKNIGVFDGLDWRVLRPYEGDDPQKISVAELKTRSVPEHIGRDVAALQAGNIEHAGVMAQVDWQWVSEPTYTVWFVSPRVHHMRASEIIGIISDIVTLGGGGIVDISLTVGEKGLKKLVSQDTGNKQLGEFSIGAAKNFNTYELNDQWKPESGGISKLSFLKTGFGALLSYLEEKEIELLFDAIDPTNTQVIKATGNPLTYNGSPMPMIVIRANTLGYPKVPDYEYRQIWNHTRYYFFDPRGLIGLDGQFDTRRMSAKLPREAGYLAGHTGIHKATWRLFPNVDFSKWGTRLVVTSTAPKSQRLRLSIPRRTWDHWKKKLPDDTTIAAVLHMPDSNQKENERIIREFRPGAFQDQGKDVAVAEFRLFNKHMPRSECPGLVRIEQPIPGTRSTRTKVENRLNYEFVELATEYNADVVLCKGTTLLNRRVLSSNSRTHEKKGETIMRLVPRPGHKVTGKLDKTDSGEVTFIQHLNLAASQETLSFEGQRFALGQRAFADRVVAFQKGKGSAEGTADPRNVLGMPGEGSGPSGRNTSLGHRGSLIVSFSKAWLVDHRGADLYVFERGPKVEPFQVEISSDGHQWVNLGVVRGQPTKLDIAGKGPPGERYRYVRLTDTGSGMSRHPTAGADIDAVGAINAVRRKR